MSTRCAFSWAFSPSIFFSATIAFCTLLPGSNAIGQSKTEIANAARIETANAFVQKYCVECHGPTSQEADRRFDQLIEAQNLISNQPVEDREQWSEILDRLNLGDMPPADAPVQPTADERLKIIDLLTNQLSQRSDSDESKSTILRRMNRMEYDASVRQLLGLEKMLADPTSNFSPDETNEGFTNVGDSLVFSDFLLNQYLAAADQYLTAAVESASQSTKDFERTFHPPFFREGNVNDGLNVDGEYQHIRENATDRGGFLWMQKLRRGVPSSGYYKIRINATAINRQHPYRPEILNVPKSDPLVLSIVAANAANSKNPTTNHATDRTLATFELADDSPEWYEATVWIDKGYLVKLGYPNGPRQIKFKRHHLMRAHGDTFPRFLSEHCPVFHDMHPDYDSKTAPAMVSKFLAQQEALREAGKPYAVFGVAHLIHTTEAWKTFYAEYQGPRIRVFEIQIIGLKSTPPTDHIAALIDKSLDDQKAIAAIGTFATRAARRPMSQEQLKPILDLYHSAKSKSNPNEALRLAFKAVLCSPWFIYHRNQSGPLDNYDLASRLSFFLTAGPPDEQLLKLATQGKLSEADVLRKETDRLLKSEHSRRFVSNFANSWLKLSKLGSMLPDFHEHPAYYNEQLEEAMREETTLFLHDAIEKDRDIDWLIDADQSFINAPLARLYGLEGVDHLELKPFKFSPTQQKQRGGLLGQASVLTASANGIDTSPVIRGVWVLESILGTPPSPPPPDIEPLEPDTRGATTIREQLVKHRNVESCNHCHRRIDPLGFALESFDEIGRYRSRYLVNKKKFVKIETAGKLPSGESFSDIGQLKKVLSTKTNLLSKNLATKLLIQATGRTHDPSDAADVLAICKLASNGQSQSKTPSVGIRSLIHQVIQSPAFRR
jgi:hypothetical protein